MQATRSRMQMAKEFPGLFWMAATATALFAQSPPGEKKATPPIAVRSPRELLASPRETVKTLYYAVVAYDLRPQLVDEAVACLDLDPARAADPAEASRLVIELEQILRILCVPLNGVPEKTDRKLVTILDGEGFKISLAQGFDGLWRFDRDTVERIPAMTRASLARFRDLQTERAALRDPYTDPSATMRRFLLDTITRDFYSAARCLDLSGLPVAERADQGPVLAKKLAIVVQRRGWMFLQEVPNHPNGPPFTWHADQTGRIILERVRIDGKEAWVFSKKTVRNIPAMYEQARNLPPDWRYVRLGVALPPLTAADDSGLSRQAPASVPRRLGSPRALLESFFRVMDAAETHDSRLVDALEFLDLSAIPAADRKAQGTKLACKLEAVLRKTRIELSSLPDDWNAPGQVLGENEGVRVEIARQRDGCWRFSQATVSQTSAFFDKLTAKDKAEQDRPSGLGSARDTMSTFLRSVRRGEYEQATECLDLSRFRPGTQEGVGPLLAYKLKYVIDRIGRVYIQEVPDAADGPRYVFYRGELGRIVIARKTDGARKGCWQFTPETVRVIEPMFRTVLKQPVSTVSDDALAQPVFWRTPGLWVRFRVPDALRAVVWRLQLYQWIGLALAVLVSILIPWMLLAQVHRVFALILRKSGSVLTKPFVAAKLRSLTWVAGWWLLFEVVALLDLPIRFVDAMLPFKTFGLAGLIGLLGVQLVDLATSVYTNSELLRPHRSLSDMVVPVSMRSLKGAILLLVMVYVIYQIGEGESLSRFLTGLGVAGLAASLAAQDALKSFFSTLLLIGERSFRIGDRIAVGELEGVVEQVGFRATRLRTAEGSLLTIPNATITSAPIDNRSTKMFSHIKTSVLVPYQGGPEQIGTLRDRMSAWLREQPKVRPDKVDVGVHSLAEQGVEVTVDLYLDDGSAAGEKEMKEAINREVMRLCEKGGAGERRAA